MTILGVGTDIIHLHRIQRLLFSQNKTNLQNTIKLPHLLSPQAHKFTSRILHTKYELPHFQSLIQQGRSEEEIVRYVAGVWSVKESVFKALDWELQGKYKRFKQWWKVNDQHGRPLINGEYLQFLEREHPEAKEKFWCSVSHDGDVLVSQVVWSRG